MFIEIINGSYNERIHEGEDGRVKRRINVSDQIRILIEENITVGRFPS